MSDWKPIECAYCGALSEDDDIDYNIYDVCLESVRLGCLCRVCGKYWSLRYVAADLDEVVNDE